MTVNPELPLLVFSTNAQLVADIHGLFAAHGYDVYGAVEPHELFSHLQRDVWLLVLIDLTAGEDGEDLLRAVFNVDREAAVLALVPEDNETLLQRIFDLGVVDVVTTPMTPIELEVRVLAHCKRRQKTHSEPTPAETSEASEVPAALLRDVMAFTENSLRQFVNLEREVLRLREALGDLAPASASGGIQKILVIDTNPKMAEFLQEDAAANHFELIQAFTGGGALEVAGQHEFDAVICSADLPDLDGQMVAGSLKGEYPYLDVMLLTMLDDTLEAELFGEDDEADAKTFRMSQEVGMDQVLRLLGNRRAQRSNRKRLSTIFQRKHSDYMRQYAELKVRLVQALKSSD